MQVWPNVVPDLHTIMVVKGVHRNEIIRVLANTVHGSFPFAKLFSILSIIINLIFNVEFCSSLQWQVKSQLFWRSHFFIISKISNVLIWHRLPDRAHVPDGGNGYTAIVKGSVVRCGKIKWFLQFPFHFGRQNITKTTIIFKFKFSILKIIINLKLVAKFLYNFQNYFFVFFNKLKI